MSNRDVEFVIRATNKASAAIDAAAQSLENLKKAEDGTSSSALDAKTGLEALNKSFGDLKGQAAALAELGKAADYIERAETSLTGLQKRLSDAKTSFDAFTADAASAAENSARLATSLASAQSALDAEKGRLAALAGELKAVNTEMGALGRAQESFPGKLTSATSALEKLTKTQSNYLTKIDTLKAKLSTMPAVRTEAQEASYQRLVTRIGEYETRLETVNGKIARNKAETEVLVTANTNGSARLGELASRQNELNTAVQASTGALKSQEGILSAAAAEYKAAATAEKEFANSAASAGKSAEKLQSEIARASTGLATTKENASATATALGLTAASTLEVGDAAKRVSGDLKSISDSIKTLKTGKVDIAIDINDRSVANYKAIIDAVRNSKATWEAARRDAAALGAQLAQTTAPTAALEAAFSRARATADQAERVFLATGEALGSFRGQANGSFLALEKTIAALGQASSAASGTANNSRAAAGAIREMNSAASSGAGSSNAFAAGMKSIYGESRQAMSILQRLRGEVLSLISAYAGIQGLRNGFDAVITSIRSVEAAENRLGAAFQQDFTKTADGMNLVRAQSLRLGQSFQTTANEYSKFAVAAQAANFSMEGMNKIFRSVAEAGRVNKLSVAELEGVYLALTQMISKGKITAEELNRQLANRLPGAFTIMSQALGHTTQEMTALMKEGKVLANEKNLVKFAEYLTKRFGSQLPEALKTTTTQLDLFKNNLEQAAIRVNAGGFGEALRQSLIKLNELFNSRAGRDFFLEIGAAAGRIISVFQLLVENVGTVASVLGALASVKVANMLISMVVAAGQSYSALTQVAAGGAEAAAGLSTTVAASTAASSGFLRIGEAARITASSLTLLIAETKSIGLMMVGVPNQSNVLTRSWQALVATTVSLRTSIATLGASTRLSAASFTSANIAAVAFRVTTAILTPLTYAFSAALRVATVAALGLWRALGGLPGLLIAVGTYLLGEWLANMATKTDDATRAIDEHQRVVTAVAEAYDNAKDKANGWQKSLKDLSADQITANVRAMRKEYDKARDGVKSYANSVADSVKFAGNAEFAYVQQLAKNFEDGKISATSFRESLEKAYSKTNNDEMRVYIEGMLETARTAQTAGKRLDEAGDAAKKFGTFAPVGAKIAEEMKKVETGTQMTAEQLKVYEENLRKAYEAQDRAAESALFAEKSTRKLGATAKGVSEIGPSAKHASDSIKTIEDASKRAATGLGEVKDKKKDIDAVGEAGKRSSLELDKLSIPDQFSSQTKAATNDMRALLEAAAETTGTIQKMPPPDTSSWSSSFSALWQSLVGGFSSAWAAISSTASQVWASIGESVSSAVSSLVNGFSSGIASIKGFFADLASTVKGYLDSIASWIDGVLQKAAQMTGLGSGSSGSSGSSIQANAEGGAIKGPGTGTSDSILSWLSNGEYVVKAAAVARYGLRFFDSLNGMRYVPAYANGGAVGRSRYDPVSTGASSSSSSDMRPVNLHLGDRAFALLGPVDVARDLVEYTRAAAARAAGRSPNWAGGKRK